MSAPFGVMVYLFALKNAQAQRRRWAFFSANSYISTLVTTPCSLLAGSLLN
jgi:hypothetical protein